MNMLQRLLAQHGKAVSDRRQAVALIAAIDAGGLPLIPARVNQIARGLGLEVSVHAPMNETIARIREQLDGGKS